MPPASASQASLPLTLVQEGERVMRICNACRYCEGFCAVFPAMERRLTFGEADLTYLANVCHDCGECYHSCQYAPPHEFALNLPLTLAGIRRESYRKYAWPGMFAGLTTRNALALGLSAIGLPAVFLAAFAARPGPAGLFGRHTDAEGAFYQVMPHLAMVNLFTAAAFFTCLAFAAGLLRFWRDIGEPTRSLWSPHALGRAVSDSLTLRYLHGGGEGCGYPTEVPSDARRWFHHLTFYGFMLCFAATSVAAVYHNFLGWRAPYAWSSLPVLLGCAGGAGLLIGPPGLFWLKRARNPDLTDKAQARMDGVFLMLLFLTSLSGFLLLVLRESPAMGTLLALHLGIVLGLFLTMPYGKFVHAIYRFAALTRNALEAQRLAAHSSQKDPSRARSRAV